VRIIVLLLTMRVDSAFSRNKSCMPDFVDCFLGEAFDKMNVHRTVTLVCDPLYMRSQLMCLLMHV